MPGNLAVGLAADGRFRAAVGDFGVMSKMNTKENLFAWIDSVLSEELPSDIVAYAFNLYEGNTDFHVQLIGAGSFDEDDADWACDELYTTGENIFLIPRTVAGQDWEKGLEYSVQMVQEYLKSGTNKQVLLSSQGVGVGFVDGDIEIVFKH